ncbi:MAG: hexokinase [Kiritimatiellae bacterium]|nr:hexokinase [Kiritimatiellia bacterium]
MQTPEEFLESNGLATAALDRAALVATFQKEMEAGLAGRPSSLKMIPTYTSPYGEIKKDTPVTVLDAGGTNLRGATVTIPSSGDILIENKEKGEMPGAKSYVSQEDFYAVLTGHVNRCRPFSKDPAVGFCFSYPAEASADGDAKLLVWTKQIQAPEIVGQWVGAELAKRLDPKPSKIQVVNDTVATLLAGKATEKPGQKFSAYLGFILGTGTNVAYIEKNCNIPKLANPPEGAMAINTESGGFNKIAQSAFDEAMDKKTSDCGSQRFEKMIAGAYLGKIGLEVFKAAARAGFFSAAARDAVQGLGSLESYDLDNFCAKYDNGKPNPLDKVFTDEADRAMARRLATPVFERAAILTAVHLAAFIIKTGGGTDPSAPVCVCIDGSTYYKTRVVSFPEIVKRELDAMLGPRNISFALTVCPDDAPMIGAAVAALLK